MRLWRSGAVCCALAFAATSLAAQKGPKPVPQVPACAFDTAAHSRTRPVDIGIRVFVADDKAIRDSADRSLTEALGALLRGAFVPPASIGTVLYPGTVLPDSAPTRPSPWSVVGPGLGAMSLRVGHRGDIEGLRWESTSYDSATNAELLRVLGQLSGMPELRSIGAMSDSAMLWLQLGLGGGKQPFAPLVRVTQSGIVIEKGVDYLGGPMPIYPITLRSNGVAGRVMMRYVVDEQGKPVENSVRIISASHLGFVKPAIEAVLGSRFRPASTAGCPVASMVEQVIRFTIGR